MRFHVALKKGGVMRIQVAPHRSSCPLKKLRPLGLKNLRPCLKGAVRPVVPHTCTKTTCLKEEGSNDHI